MNMSLSLKTTQLQTSTLEYFNSRVQKISMLNTSIIQVLLLPDTNFSGYQAGQYIELILPDGSSRPFSIANFSANSHQLELHIELKPDSTVTTQIIRHMQDQREILISAAKGDVRYRPSAGPQIFMAAGTGFAQIKSLVEEALLSAENTAKDSSQLPPIYLVWGTEHDRQKYMQNQINLWCRTFPHFHYLSVEWLASEGWESAFENIIDSETNQHLQGQFYACGSPDRVYSILDLLQHSGVPRTHFQSDVLAYAPRPTIKSIT